MISVCLATYNGEKYLRELLDSVLIQLEEMDELIVSDDHSNDSTLEILSSYSDKRIKIYQNTKGQGYSNNFENALEMSKGDIIFFCDQDDVWLDNKVKLFKEKLLKYDLVMSDVSITDAELNVIDQSHFNTYKLKKGFLYNFIKTRYIGASMAFRREILKKLIPFPKNKTYCAYDYWLTLVGEFYYNTELIYIPTMLYRRHSTNVSSGGLQSNFSLGRKLWTRMYSFFHLILRC